MPNGNLPEQWFLEVNGKKFGPYTMAQIEALVRHQEIVGEDRITAPHLNGSWISVQDFVRKTGQAEVSKKSAAPATVPPRPDERTLTSITSPSIRTRNETQSTGTDAISNLFEILQAARERKTQSASNSGAVGHDIVEMPRPVKSSSGGAGLFWFALPAMAVAGVVAWKVLGTSATPEAESAQQSQNALTKAQPPAARAPVASAPPPVQPKVVSAPASGFAPGRQVLRPAQTPATTASIAERDRERERELERERERESERELEREKEREAEYARNYSTNEPSHREREREREREAERGADRAAASVGIVPPEGLPVTGGTPVDPAAFRDMNRDSGSESN